MFLLSSVMFSETTLPSLMLSASNATVCIWANLIANIIALLLPEYNVFAIVRNAKCKPVKIMASVFNNLSKNVINYNFRIHLSYYVLFFKTYNMLVFLSSVASDLLLR